MQTVTDPGQSSISGAVTGLLLTTAIFLLASVGTASAADGGDTPLTGFVDLNADWELTLFPQGDHGPAHG